jgi:hypothetical protein
MMNHEWGENAEDFLVRTVLSKKHEIQSRKTQVRDLITCCYPWLVQGDEVIQNQRKKLNTAVSRLMPI